VSVLAVTAAAFAVGVAMAVGAPRGVAQDETVPAAPSACNEQEPQDFLVRKNWVVKVRMPPEEQRARRELAHKAVRYRTEQYGHFPGFGRPEWNAHPPMHYAKRVDFFGRRTRLHEKILPAVACAEAEIRRTCGAFPYQPRRLSGIRDRNTYHNGEVSNHVYGIALDVDPSENTCCGCVAPWRDHPLCRREVSSIFERMVMPECWVIAFRKFGFYWLGDDELEDTMHFEFLGDPARIVRGS
jgi:hypothetical protein